MVDEDTRPTMEAELKRLSKADKATLTRADTAFSEIIEGRTLDLWMPLINACVVGLRLANIVAGTDDRQSKNHIKAFDQFISRRFPAYAKASKNDFKHAKWFADDDSRRVMLDELRNPDFNARVHTLSGARRRVEIAIKRAAEVLGQAGQTEPDPPPANSSRFSLMHELGHVMSIPQLQKRAEALNDKLERLSLHGDILSEDAERVEGYFSRLQRDMDWDDGHLGQWKREVLFELLTDEDIVWMYEQRQPRRRRNGRKAAEAPKEE